MKSLTYGNCHNCGVKEGEPCRDETGGLAGETCYCRLLAVDLACPDLLDDPEIRQRLNEVIDDVVDDLDYNAIIQIEQGE